MSDNETDNIPLSKLRDIERYKNAERMARALKPYLPNHDEQTSRSASRGRTKDKRICQLSAAYKYCVHLEKGLKDAYDKCSNILGPLTDDYKLLSSSSPLNNSNNQNIQINSTQNNLDNILVDFSTMNNTETQISINNSCFKLSDALDDENENFYLSPNQNHQNNASIHESSTISATNGHKTTNISSKKLIEECAKLRTVNNLRNFDHVDTSPILSCYIDANNNIIEDKNKRKRRFEDEQNEKPAKVNNTMTPANSLVLVTKRLMIDSAEKENSMIIPTESNNLSIVTPKIINLKNTKRNKTATNIGMSSTLMFSTPNPANATATKLDDTTKSEPTVALNDDSNNGNDEFRKVYFLRSSTIRLRNMLNGNNAKNTATTLPAATRGSKVRNSTTSTAIANQSAQNLTGMNKNIALNKLNKIDSSTASSRSSSLTTTPSVRANDTSSSSHELNFDNLDHNNNNIKIFEENQTVLQSKDGFNLILN